MGGDAKGVEFGGSGSTLATVARSRWQGLVSWRR